MPELTLPSPLARAGGSTRPATASVATSAATTAATSAATRAGGAVRFEAVGKTYRSAAGPVPALVAITLDIPAGGIFGIIGRSGAGKSSLLRTINRLEQPSSGRVWVDGQDISTFNDAQLVALRRRVGMIFQHFNLLSAKTVFDNVALPLRVAGWPEAAVRERVAELLALVGLQDKHSTYPGRLSGGQKQRVGIARALVHRPEILLCDEATSALDPETTQAILALLKRINQQLGLTIVLITHEMGVIREICDEVLVLERGHAVERGPVWRVFGQPQHDATRALLSPLAHALSDEVRAGLAANGERVIELRFTGEGGLSPDLQAIAALLGGPVRLLHGGVDRIQGHTHGQLLVSAPVGGPPPERLVAAGLAHQAQEIGHA